jgi:aminocarboxymuconate-semialdehyde decarboxylase
MKQALRFQNDFNAGVQRDHPSKFTSGFVVHPGYVRGALWEMERCVKVLGMKLLCLPTHYMDTIGQWRCIFDEENEAIFELASELNLAVEIHPYDGEKFIKLQNTSWRFHLIWMLAQCADAYHFLTLNGYAQKYPGMRVCFAHGGQLAQMNLGRRIQGFDGRPDLFEGKTHPRKSVGHPNIFFDTLVHDTGSLHLLVENQGAKQVLVGLDDPYPLGEMDSEKQSSYPGKIIDLAMERGIITSEEADDMWDENVVQWLFGNDQEAKKTFYERVRS